MKMPRSHFAGRSLMLTGPKARGICYGTRRLERSVDTNFKARSQLIGSHMLKYSIGTDVTICLPQVSEAFLWYSQDSDYEFQVICM